MTRAELIQKVYQSNAGLTIQQAEDSLDIIFGAITETLAKGGRAELRGFGVFTTRQREARIGRNPRTGEKVEIVKKKVPFFKAGKQLNAYLNS